MAILGPFEPSPLLGVAVSGGPDSLALAVLARDWARSQGGNLLALIVDHGLRPESAAEAMLTVNRLSTLGIASEILTLSHLAHGPGLAERARLARYDALEQRCIAQGVLHLLLGHHARDQAETVQMRAAAGSKQRGMAAMASLVERPGVRLLRPLLSAHPEQLRQLLIGIGMEWVDDPSNTNPLSLRARLRLALAEQAGPGDAVGALLAGAIEAGQRRTSEDAAVARVLAGTIDVHPAGWAVLRAGGVGIETLGRILQTIAGREYRGATAGLTRLASDLRPATFAGARILPAGRMGASGDWLVVREANAMAPAIPALPGAIWDGRFRLRRSCHPDEGAMLGPLGDHATKLRARSAWPVAVLRTLPSIWRHGKLEAVPHLAVPDARACARHVLEFSPPIPFASAPFVTICSPTSGQTKLGEDGGGARSV